MITGGEDFNVFLTIYEKEDPSVKYEKIDGFRSRNTASAGYQESQRNGRVRDCRGR